MVQRSSRMSRVAVVATASLAVVLLPMPERVADAVQAASCNGLPSAPIHDDAVIGKQVVSDVDGDGRFDRITGYWLGASDVLDADEVYLHLEVGSGWGTALRLDVTPGLTEGTLTDPRGVVSIAGRNLIVAGVAQVLPGEMFALFDFRDCLLQPVLMNDIDFPSIWAGGGPVHDDWFSCTSSRVTMLVMAYDDPGPPRIYVSGFATGYRYEDPLLVPEGEVALDLPQTRDSALAAYPDCAELSGAFVDDDASIFEEAIEWLAFERITRGCNPPINDRFCPGDDVTRGEMAAFLVRAMGYTDDGGGDLFVDDDNHTFETDIDKLGTAGVTRGCNPPANDRFCPDDNLIRGEMAALLKRATD